MDPCHFLRILVGNLAIKSTLSSKPSSSSKVHTSTSSSSSFFAHIKINPHSQRHVATVPLISDEDPTPHSLASSFDFTKPQIDQLINTNGRTRNLRLNISLYRNPTTSSCAPRKPTLLANITVPIHLPLQESRACILHNGWVALDDQHHNKKANSAAQLLHFTLRVEPDPRFVFRFDGEPECSPQVFQVRGEMKQPVFTCKFSFRDKNNQTQRKGWSITVHDLSGSPVAAASIVTPFVPSPGSNRVCKSNPGAWLIIRPDGDGTWKPWGRLEAWREPNHSNAVGYRFEDADRVTLASSTISSHHGGKFTIDVTSGVTPRGSRDKGFVMSAKVEGSRKCSKTEVEVGVEHVSCTEDAAAFVALAGAMELSMDACKSFIRKLPKELRQ
ncbi:hypothetical protein TanjilG_22987 [Lupinus angustifolius]|uniref:Formin-like protein 18 n=1 Tax=Lupinus angustifolius TaxID=3871 RepID=A0A1J7HEV3_LUPAN|nr:PREDICTED: uncharacterized protein LOC109348526 [Lupinus angustifolius]OIW11180.1 hypothetical protein TanjilG_22987 [Lupinus angustifolius]